MNELEIAQKEEILKAMTATELAPLDAQNEISMQTYSKVPLSVSIEIEKSNAIFDLVDLIRIDVIIYNDLADFSNNLKQAVKMLLDSYR